MVKSPENGINGDCTMKPQQSSSDQELNNTLKADFDAVRKLKMEMGKSRSTASGNLQASSLGQERYIRPIPLEGAKQCYAMVGLPARGKSCIAYKLARYLNWIGAKSRVFNVGMYRRSMVGVNMSSDYYSPDNMDGVCSRTFNRKVALHAVDELLSWLNEDPDAVVGILDATNTTRDRRRLISERCAKSNIQIMFIESVLDIPEVEERNIREHKLRCPDYQGCDPDDAFQDFSQRIKNYKKVYQTLSLELDRELTFIRVSNVTQFHINSVNSTIQSKSAYFLMNLRPHIQPTLYFTRHGETEFNMDGKIGGDSCLSENGRRYGEELGRFVREEGLSELPVWTSLMRRTLETGSYLPNTSVERYKALNELDAGQCDGLTYQQIETDYPEEFALRDLDKYNYRYPRGESYHDLCCRLEPVIMDLEKGGSVFVICHQAVLRCIVGYLLDIPVEEIPYIKIPLHTVIKIVPTAYGCEREDIKFGISSAITHRDKQSVESIEKRLIDAGINKVEESRKDKSERVIPSLEELSI